jgi:hypothetical protein
MAENNPRPLTETHQIPVRRQEQQIKATHARDSKQQDRLASQAEQLQAELTEAQKEVHS